LGNSVSSDVSVAHLETGVSSVASANRRLGTGTSDGAIAGVDAIADAVNARNHDQHPGGRDNALTDPMD